MTTVALPVFHSRIAPVLDSCLRVLVIQVHQDGQTETSELNLNGLSPLGRVKALERAGVTTLICGGISNSLYTMLEWLGICVICGIVGDVEEVLSAYLSNRLDEPRFQMPGLSGEHIKPHSTSERSLQEMGDGLDTQQANRIFSVRC